MWRSARIVILATALAVALPVASVAGEAPDPLLGTWQLNLAKSKFNPAPGPKGQLRTYSRTGDTEKLVSRGVDSAGKPNLVQYTARFDGKDYPITGSLGGDQISLKRVDASTTVSTQKRDGKPAIIARRTVSQDGKTLTVTSQGTTAEGVPIDSTLVFDRR